MTTPDLARAEQLNDEATLLAKRGDLEAAERTYRAAIEAAPALAKLWSNLGNVLRMVGKPVDAEAAYRRAVEIGGSARARRNYAVLLAELDREGEVDALGAGLPDAERADLRAAVAEVAMQRGDVVRAAEAWLEVKALAPATPKLAEHLAACVDDVPYGPGLRLVVPPAPGLVTPYVLREHAAWIDDELPWVRRLLEPGDVAVDVGASFGPWTIEMAARVGAEGRVIAFEPASAMHACLVESARRMGFAQVDARRMALSAVRGEATLHRPRAIEDASLRATDEAIGSERVKVGVLDDVAAELGGRRLALVKIDAMGEDARVLEGGERLLRDHEPVVVVELRRGDKVDQAVLTRLERLGLRLYRVAPGPCVLVPLEPSEHASEHTFAAVACSPRAAVRLHARGLLAKPRLGVPSPEIEAAGSARAARSRPGAMRPSTAVHGFAAAYFAAGLEADVDLRLGRLAQAFARARTVGADEPTVGGACAMARMGEELGRFDEALRAATWALEEMDGGATGDDVGLAPSARFDDEPIRTTPAAWVEAALVDLVLRRSARSSLWDRDLVELAKRARRLPHPNEHAERILAIHGI